MKSLIGLLVVLLWTQVDAQNLLSNGYFDTGIDGWENPFVTSEWVSDDGAPISGNGSMKVTGSINNNGTYGMNSFHIFIQPGYWYLTAASFKTPAASVSERGLYSIKWYDSNDVMLRRDSIDSGYGVDDDVWIPLDAYLQAPENANYLVMSLRLQNGIPGETAFPFGLWDDAVLMEETIFMNDFD